MSTAIEWTDETWNPVVGCTKVSQGCKHCYAKTLHDKRHKAALAGKAVHPQYLQPFETVQLMPDRLEQPLHWRKPRRVFVNSVSDLFHEEVPDEFLDRVFAIMQATPLHTFQILTKRPQRMLEYVRNAEFRLEVAGEALADRMEWCHANEGAPWPLANVWLGVSVEDQKAADERIPLLLETPAAVRFLSCEPLLGPVDLSLWLEEEGYIDDKYVAPLDWVIVGGESGPDARQCDLRWVETIVADCDSNGVACFVKQLGSQPIMNYYDWLEFAEGRFDKSLPVYVTTRRSIGGDHTYYRWYLGDNGERHDGQPPVDAWVEFPCSKKGGDPAEWPERLRVREFPAPQVPA